MEGGEIMQKFLEFIISVAASIVGYFICKWLDRISLSGSCKTLHGVVKRSLIKTMITSINKKTSGRARLFSVETMQISRIHGYYYYTQL